MQVRTGGANQPGLLAYTRLTREQRAQIEPRTRRGTVGRRLGRHETTIEPEVKRVGTGAEYDTEQVQVEADCLRRMPRRPTKCTDSLEREMLCM
jgi:IS30 family transposase